MKRNINIDYLRITETGACITLNVHGELLSYDGGHLTQAGAIYFSSKLKSFFNAKK